MKKILLRRLSIFLLVFVLAAAILPIQQVNALPLVTPNLPTIKTVAAPSNLTAKLSSNMGITLNWTDNSSNESGFVLQRQLIAPPSFKSGFVDIAQLDANTTTYKNFITMSQLAAGYRFAEYRIKALGSGVILDSVYTDVTSIEFKSPETPQATVSFSADASVFVQWKGCTEAYVDHYVVRRKAPGAASYTVVASVPANYTDYSDESQKIAGVYQYTVEVIGFFNAFTSSPVSITVPGTAPAAPSDLVITPLSANSIKMSWTDNSDNETGFVIDYTVNGVAKASFYSTPTNLTFSALPVGTYVFKIKAINAAGSSAYSNTATATIPFTKPAAPSNLAATALSSSSVSLTWSDNSNNETAFYIERKTGSASFTKIAETAANATVYVDAGLSSSTIYTYRVVAVNFIDASDYSGSASATTQTAASGIDYSSASPWAIPEIEAAYQFGLLTDKLHGGFQQNITREEFCEIAIRLYEKLSHSQAVFDGNNPFTDTTNSEIVKAYKLGITNGTSPTEFSPNNPITRQEICVMIVRTLQAAFPGLNITVPNPNIFADNSSIASWAINEVRYANLKGIMNGIGGNMFNPLNNTPRDQGVAIIKRSYVSFSV